MITKIFCDIVELDTIKKINKKKIVNNLKHLGNLDTDLIERNNKKFILDLNNEKNKIKIDYKIGKIFSKYDNLIEVNNNNFL